MFNMKILQNKIYHFVYILSVLLCIACPPTSHAEPEATPNPAASVVEITVHTRQHDTESPWNTTWKSWIATGFIVDGKRILTTAQLIDNAVYISIRPNDSPKTFEAEVDTISHEVNLALLTIKDETFFNTRTPLPLGDLPKPEDKVSLYGYPIGGNKLSITAGIISRIEYQTYAHSGLTFQAIQVDAAVNSGSVGSPALVDGKVIGIVSDIAPEIAGTATENTGYLTPASRIKQLLEDLLDGTLDGVPELWIDYQFITNPTHKQHYRLTPDQTGILINRLCANSDAALLLFPNDVITAIDGKPISETNFIQTNGKQYSNFQNHIDLHQINDIVSLDVIRDGRLVKQNLELNKKSLTKNLKESSPRYFIFGGFVFLASRTLPACVPTTEEETGDPPTTEEDTVQIVQVLPSPSNIGFHDVAPMNISTVNGETFSNWATFQDLVKDSSQNNIVLKNETGYQIVINRQLAEKEHDSLLEKYRIPTEQPDNPAEEETAP